ncbi:hypothetical protein VNO77_37771 [Canavalia gladiata]|uniref:Uncharacterized protein n=1 Tax=Canavalia gladiata TaxID=3824 RepID=A0AAN9PUX6_CANGL
MSMSSPCPLLAHTGISKVYDTSKLCLIETQKPCKSGHSKCSNQFVGPEHSSETRLETNNHFVHTSDGFPQVKQCYAERNRKFSDATSSDWSIFTSSDEASFISESTMESFRTVDYGDSAVKPSEEVGLLGPIWGKRNQRECVVLPALDEWCSLNYGGLDSQLLFGLMFRCPTILDLKRYGILIK